MNVRKLTTASVLASIGVVSSHIIYIPLGVSKLFPIQHAINLISAVLLGPAYSVAVAFVISLLRNIMGTGSLLAFPGSMIGAFLAALVYKKTKKPSFAMVGEVIGTGVIGAIVSYPVAQLLMGKEVALFGFLIPFITSSFAGVIIGYVIFRVVYKLDIFNEHPDGDPMNILDVETND